jgi:hypothetical protein
MADRLAELLRQRALLQEHLEWLDAEIAAASNKPSTPRAPWPPAPAPRPSTTIAASVLAAATSPAPVTVNPQSSFGTKPPTADSGATAAVGDEILDQYRVAPDSLKTDVRKGCLLYFVAAFALLGLGVTVLWLAFRQ